MQSNETIRRAFTVLWATALFLLPACDQEKATHPPTAGRDEVVVHEAPQKSGQDAVSMIVELWRDRAVFSSVQPEAIDQVAFLIQDVMRDSHPSVTDATIDSYDLSLKEFLKHNAAYLNHPQSSSGTAHWLVYCTAKSFGRVPNQVSEGQEDQRHFERLIADVSHIIEQETLGNVPLEQRAAVRDVVHEGAEHFRRETVSRVSFYTNDLLCPAFKKEPSEDMIKRLVIHYREEANLPSFQEPRRMMLTQEEDFTLAYKNFIENEISLFLFELFVQTFDGSFKETEYWGHMDYKVSSADNLLSFDTMWPVQVLFAPDDNYNRDKGWKR